MVETFTILDERGNWAEHAVAAAKRRGYNVKRISRGYEAPETGGLGFLRPHAEPTILQQNKERDWPIMFDRLTMVQDPAQVELYDDKSAQFWRFDKYMPPTWRFDNWHKAADFARSHDRFPIVSKADVGASSVNVRIIKDRDTLLGHIKEAFTSGIVVDHCSGGGTNPRRAHSRQRGYVLLQQFIPHDVTWRVNRVGDHFAIFKRFNYKDRNVAQTGNTIAVMELDDKMIHLIDYARNLTDAIRTKWVALDILDAGDTDWKLLETSLAWPWSVGSYGDAPFFGDTQRKWGEMWDLMIDEHERGAFNANNLATYF